MTTWEKGLGIADLPDIPKFLKKGLTRAHSVVGENHLLRVCQPRSGHSPPPPGDNGAACLPTLTMMVCLLMKQVWCNHAVRLQFPFRENDTDLNTGCVRCLGSGY